MVFFTCNHCGESVKKVAVEKHYNFKCRGAVVSVSCMDCMKDFHGEEYVAHTKCITELEKYSGKNYVPKESKNNGAKKQESWMDIIRSILESEDYKLSAAARSEFQRLQSFDNVPRKKAKFQNFVTKCMRMHKRQAEEVWTVLEKEIEKMKPAKEALAAVTKANKDVAAPTPTPAASVTNGIDKLNGQENGVKSKKKKEKKAEKRELTESNDGETPAIKKSKKQKTETAAAVQEDVGVEAASAVAENDNEEQQKFAWSEVLKKIVDKHVEGIALEKLKKKLLKKYTVKLGLTEALTDKQQKKFEKKFSKNLKKCSNLQLTDDNVVRRR